LTFNKCFRSHFLSHSIFRIFPKIYVVLNSLTLPNKSRFFDKFPKTEIFRNLLVGPVWILCPMKTCSDSIQLTELPKHFNSQHPGYGHRLTFLSSLPSSLTWKCSNCKYICLGVKSEHQCDQELTPSDLIETELHTVTAKCPSMECSEEFDLTPTLWADIDEHLSKNHEIHWLYFKKERLKSATRCLVVKNGQLVQFNPVNQFGTRMSPDVVQCQRCQLYLLPNESALHYNKCYALKCTLREFTLNKWNNLKNSLRKNLFHVKLYLC